jgi:hypothetical protein
MPGEWKILNQRSVGTSHTRAGEPCQDAELVSLCTDQHGEEFLVVACADGAGSAKHAEQGSAHACTVALEFVSISLREGLPKEDAELILTTRRWLASVCGAIGDLAAERGAAPRDFACTMLLAVLGKSRSMFAQMGDGAIVKSDGSSFDVAFWPQRGEYANQTTFISDPESLDNVQASVGGPVDEIAMLTDGLQSLALNYAAKSVHAPFFTPMFRALRAAEDPNLLQTSLLKFLDSEGVNQRTDDDKTLVLATRLLPPSP